MLTTDTGSARAITPSGGEPIEPGLPTQDEVDKRLRLAAEAGVSPCNWIPPLWEDIKQDAEGRRVLPDNAKDDNEFPPLRAAGTPSGGPLSAEARNAGIQAFLQDCADVVPESRPGEQVNPLKKKWPHPNSDFRHTDPKEFSDENVKALEAAVTGCGGVDAVEALKKLKEIVGSTSQGLKRLSSVFEWILWRTTVLLDDINNSLNDSALAAFDSASQPGTQEDKYNAARQHYIDFLVDLDDREPETKSSPVDLRDPKRRSGYGRALQWLCLEPVIICGRIKEARVVAKWNPHSSSSGIPLPDK